MNMTRNLPLAMAALCVVAAVSVPVAPVATADEGPNGYAKETWVPDWSHGKAKALAPSEFSCDRVRCWSQGWQKQYRLAWHHPMVNVRVKNLTDHDGVVALKCFISKLGEAGAKHSLGERGSTKVTVGAGKSAEAMLCLEYHQFAEKDPVLGKDRAAKGRYLLEFGPSADDLRGSWELELVEDIFFEYPPVPERKVKLLAFEGPHCVFSPTPTPCEDFLRPYYGKLSQEDYTLLDRAVRTFEWNALGKSCEQKIYVNPAPWGDLRAVNPSSAWFKGVWNWDSAFIMMAARRWDPELARDQMRLWMLIQGENGEYPDSWTEGDGIQFPPSFTNSKPPVFGWAMWQLHKTAPDLDFLREAYASLRKNCAWWKANRYNAKYGLYHYDGQADEPESMRRNHAGWESGWDDSPRWDGEAWHVLAIDLNCFLVLQQRALRDFAAELGLAEESKAWAAEAKALETAIENGFWDERDGCYYDRNFVTGRFNRSVTPAGFMPLLLGTASKERAARLAQQAVHEEPGWPSVAYDDPKYDPMGYWRGRTWLNVAYFALRGFKLYGYDDIAERGRKTLFDWIRNDPSAIYETYNSRTGLPCGASHFSWSCTFVLSFLLDWNLPAEAEMPAKAATMTGCVAAPSVPRNATLRTAGGPLVQAHRGSRGEYADNAAGGFRLCLGKGIRGFETDIRFTKDHELVIMHDGRVNRTTDGTGIVEEMTLAELKKCRIETCSEPVPTAEEVMAAFAGRDDVFVEFEMKARPGDFYTQEVLEEYCRKLDALAKRMMKPGTYAFTCFNATVLETMRKVDAAAPLGYIMGELGDAHIATARRIGCVSVAPTLGTSALMVKKAHDAGLTVCLWMVQNAADYAEAKGKGADRVTSDYPMLLVRALEGRPKKLVAMDLDATLCQHRSPIPEENLKALKALDAKYKCIMSGAGNAPRIYRQMGNYPIDIVGNYGMQIAEAADGNFRIVRAVTNEVDRTFFRRETDALRKKYGYTEYEGNPLEFHASGMVTFGLLGTTPSAEHKVAFDPDRKKRRAMYPEVCGIFRDFSVYIGGSTSFDFAGKEYNKYDSTLKWAEEHGYTLDDIVFIGDDFADGGGDSHVRIKGMDHIVITDYRNFAKAVSVLLKF